MSILSYGTPTSDVEAALGLKEPLNSNRPSQRDQNIINLVNSVEAHIRLKTGRNFEQQTLTDEAYDVRGATKKTIILKDRPIQTWTSIKEVLTWDDNGDPDNTYTVPRDDYFVYTARARIKMQNGYWKEGFQRYLVSAVIGYTSAEITNASKDDVRIVKELIVERLSQVWQLLDKQDLHVSGKTFEQGSITLEKNWTKVQRDMLMQLRQGQL